MLNYEKYMEYYLKDCASLVEYNGSVKFYSKDPELQHKSSLARIALTHPQVWKLDELREGERDVDADEECGVERGHGRGQNRDDLFFPILAVGGQATLEQHQWP